MSFPSSPGAGTVVAVSSSVVYESSSATGASLRGSTVIVTAASFDLQDRLVTDLAAGLAVEIDRRDREALDLVGTKSIEAYQAFSRGMLNLRLAGRESMERAIALFERALELDPDIATQQRESEGVATLY